MQKKTFLLLRNIYTFNASRIYSYTDNFSILFLFTFPIGSSIDYVFFYIIPRTEHSLLYFVLAIETHTHTMSSAGINPNCFLLSLSPPILFWYVSLVCVSERPKERERETEERRGFTWRFWRLVWHDVCTWSVASASLPPSHHASRTRWLSDELTDVLPLLSVYLSRCQHLLCLCVCCV